MHRYRGGQLRIPSIRPSTSDPNAVTARRASSFPDDSQMGKQYVERLTSAWTLVFRMNWWDTARHMHGTNVLQRHALGQIRVTAWKHAFSFAPGLGIVVETSPLASLNEPYVEHV
jgi:hypothetical protein